MVVSPHMKTACGGIWSPVGLRLYLSPVDCIMSATHHLLHHQWLRLQQPLHYYAICLQIMV